MLYVKLLFLIASCQCQWGLLLGVCTVSGDVELSATNNGSLSLDACKSSYGKFSVKVVTCVSFAALSNDISWADAQSSW
jgi:hypothetical protein